MKIKTKISLALLILFMLFLGISGLGIYNLHHISRDMKVILKANFETIDYTKNMLKSLDGIRKLSDENQLTPLTVTPLLSDFGKNLEKQEKNVTELGEQELTENVHAHFDLLKKSLLNKDLKTMYYTISILNNYLYDISELNTLPIIRKNQEAEKTANDAIFLMTLAVTLCFLFSFSFIFNFPSYIANPIKELTEGIKKVADRNYQERLHFSSNDEFGELATAFNTMARRLDEYEHSNLARIISEKQRIETIIDGMNDPLVGLDENNKILFVNTEGCVVLGLTKENLIGKYAPDIALKNDLLRSLLTDDTPIPLKIFSNNKESHFEKAILNINAKDKAIGKVILLRNITQFQERDVQNTHVMSAIFHELNNQVGTLSKHINAFEIELNQSFNSEQHVQFQQIKEDMARFYKVLSELQKV